MNEFTHHNRISHYLRSHYILLYFLHHSKEQGSVRKRDRESDELINRIKNKEEEIIKRDHIWERERERERERESEN